MKNTFMGWSVGETFQSRVTSYQYGKIEKFVGDKIHVRTPRHPEFPGPTKDTVLEVLMPGEFVRQWKRL